MVSRLTLQVTRFDHKTESRMLVESTLFGHFYFIFIFILYSKGLRASLLVFGPLSLSPCPERKESSSITYLRSRDGGPPQAGLI